MLKLKDCFKVYTADQDKAASPAQTVALVKARLEEKCPGVLEETKRVDTGRLGIPVFLSICGPEARAVMPTRKQMGKGASPEQAEASALMELVERFSYFSFWADETNFTLATWSEAEDLFGSQLMDIAQICQSVDDDLTIEDARRLMDLVRWRFCPVLNVATGETCVVPLDWFKTLNEFNGSSAGNTPEESILQGGCELVERHVSALVDRSSPELPTINQETLTDPVLKDLCQRFRKNGVLLLLKDISLGMPVPTVAALAFDPKTFPALSEIVYTAGTAANPVKAAVRAVTEIAQLAGDFETARVYEASGLRKFTDPAQFDWLLKGPVVDLNSLPCVEDANIRVELSRLADGLLAQGYTLYTLETTRADLDVPANYNFVPGFDFRERTQNRSLGLFVGRKLAEESADDEALAGLSILSDVAPDVYYLPFFQALLMLRMGDIHGAAALFAKAEPAQPGAGERALCAFYQAYALSQNNRWESAMPHLDRAIELDGEVKEYFNLRGVGRFKAGEYERAKIDFHAVLTLDSGSAPDLANLGLCHKFLGEREEALEYLESALKLDAGLDYARKHLKELCEGAGE
ncbi:MAG: YcaO-like family protein [Humidesulfovibrio sp.]|uniref:YcaO-like family protein n=1 Tax=Humidesulfovibrio sp. TaxID=2910988 RepID=UPI00273346E8|nr:YcaO-like family protein [Humidesulfovibrio sp.]MDP2848115.1 YcaO-like family protein [Humidesulfovibrio sp.]